MFEFICKTTNFKKTGKVKYKIIKEQTESLSETQYKNCVTPKTIKFFKNLGGKESVTRSYNAYGYTITKIKSISPDGENQTIREFTINWRE